MNNVKDLEILKSYIDIRIDFVALSSKQDKTNMFETRGARLYEPIGARIAKLNINNYTGEFRNQMSKFVEVFQKERNDYYAKIKKNRKILGRV